VFFSAGSEKSSVLGVHDFSGSAEKAEYRKIIAVLQKKFRQSPRLLTSQAPRNNQ